MIDGKLYSFMENGVRRSGYVKKSDTEKYYFDSVSGEALTGIFKVKVNDTEEYTYYFDGENSVKTGIQEYKGNKYYFSSNGTMSTGLKIIDDKRYFFDPETGCAVYGLVDAQNGYSYYLKEDGTYKTGLQTINGRLYYFRLQMELP